MKVKSITNKYSIGDKVKIIDFVAGQWFSLMDLIEGEIIEEKTVWDKKHLVVKTENELFLLTEDVISYFNSKEIETNQNEYISSLECLPVISTDVLIAFNHGYICYEIRHLGIYKGSADRYTTIDFAWNNGGMGIGGTYWREIPKLENE